MEGKTVLPNAEALEAIVADCVYRDEELPEDGSAPDDAVMADGVTRRFGFHPERLASHRNEVAAMLAALPEPFHESGGGGWSFLNACATDDGAIWGQHWDVEHLFVLGMALGMVRCLLPQEMWPMLPGGMPYYMVCDDATGAGR